MSEVNKALTWDEAGTRAYETGVKKVALYVMNDDGTYKDGVAWNGITAISESPSGADENALYADNIKYASLRSAEQLGASIEAYTYPEEFCQCDGLGVVVDGVYVGQQSRKAFGLCYRTEVGSDTLQADDESGYKLHILYNATASPSDKSYSTINESPDAITFNWTLTTTAVEVGTVGSGETAKYYKPTALITIDSTKLDAAGKGRLKALEDTLYGKGNVAPKLPTPKEVITAMMAS